VPSDGADQDAVRPSENRLNRSLEPDVRGDHHPAVDDQHHGAATGPVEVAGELSCPQVGVGRLSGAACAEGRGQIRRGEGRRAPANRELQ
jgi:hypothetical protein